MLEIRDLNVYYGGIHALKGISLNVEEGQIVSMIGSNGAGKSSMMNAISGIVKYQSGEILFRGEKLPAQANKIVKQGICQVPEGRLIFANLTTYENLILGAYLRKDKAAIKRACESIALELSAYNIRVNCVAPGVINTDMAQELGRHVLDDLAAETPLGRLGTPEDIAHAVSFFASEKCHKSHRWE